MKDWRNTIFQLHVKLRKYQELPWLKQDTVQKGSIVEKKKGNIWGGGIIFVD